MLSSFEIKYINIISNFENVVNYTLNEIYLI